MSESPPRALARIDSQSLLAQAIEKGANVETLEKLVALAKDMKADMAREAWYEAMAAFQRDCPAIRKSKTATIPSRTGRGFSYAYAPLDEIVSSVQPVLAKHGLSFGWRSRIETNQVAVTCRVSHTLGHHEESGETCIPIVPGDGGANPMQRVGIATTYAKRYSLIGILGVAPEDDDDTASLSERPGRVDRTTGEVYDEAPPPSAGHLDERAALLLEITKVARVAKLTTTERQDAWRTYVGDTVTQAEAPLEALRSLLSWVRTRAGDPS